MVSFSAIADSWIYIGFTWGYFQILYPRIRDKCLEFADFILASVEVISRFTGLE